MPTLVIAHRGASGEAPENTMAAFELARTQSADMIELDVRPIADGTIVVFHDDTTERWNGRADTVASLTREQIRTLRIGGEPVPTFEEVCRWARDTGIRLNIEIKGWGFEESVAATLREYYLAEQVLISSFHPAALLAMRTIAPEFRRGALMGVRSSNPRVRFREAWPFRALRDVEAAAWHPSWELPLLPRLLPLVRKRGYEVNVWTVDDLDVMRRLIVAGADGIISNYPARLRHVVDSIADNATR